MSFHEALARLALADARRFEAETARMLRDILRSCRDAATRKVIEEIIAEEEGHLRQLEGASAAGTPASQPVPPAAKQELPAIPDTILEDGPIRDRLRQVLRKEEASVAFYSLLAERTLIPPVRRVFEAIAAQERGHAAKLAEHLRRASTSAAGRGEEP